MILIALGSNMGDRQARLDEAVQALLAENIKTLARSKTVETPALLPKGAPPDWDIPYFNQVINVETRLKPHGLLEVLKRVEMQLGRQKRAHWGPREIDLDLIAYNKDVIDTDELVLPHPQMAYRRFVLAPLVELSPDWKHPVLGKTSTEMLAELVR